MSDPRLKELDPIDGPPRHRLEYHYRKFFPHLVKRLEKQGPLELRRFIGQKERLYRRVLAENIREVGFAGAEELAVDAAFDRPRPKPEPDLE